MVIVVAHGIYEPSSNQVAAVYFSFCAHAFGKTLNLSVILCQL